MNMIEARAALVVPAAKANNNCVQDAKARLRQALKLAGQFHSDNDPAPGYLVQAVADLKSWIEN